MEETHCEKEHQLGIIEGSIARMEKELFNGNGGLVKTVPVLSENVKVLTKSVDELRFVITDFVKFQSESTGGKKKEEDIQKSSLRTWQIVSIVIGSIVGMIAIFTFFKTVSINNRQNTVERQMYWKQDRPIDSTTRGEITGTPMDSTALKPVWDYDEKSIKRNKKTEGK